MNGLGDQALDLACHHEPQQNAEYQNPQAGSQSAGVEGHGQFTAGDQQQMPGRLITVVQACDLMAAQLGQAPGFNLAIVLRERQVLTVLQLHQQVAGTVINRGGAQRGIAADFIEQGFGFVWRVQRLNDQVGVGGQLAQCL